MERITRIWHGITKTEHADEYLKYIEKTGLSDYRNIKGNISAKILRRIEDTICHFLTVTEWDSYESIKKFAGEDYEKARYYDEDKKFLLEFEDKVIHYETYEHNSG
jgi:heme-degrading monooxygenase HmoA